MKQEPTNSTAGWILSFAGRKKSLYISSVLLAALGVLCSVAPYVIMGIMTSSCWRRRCS